MNAMALIEGARQSQQHTSPPSFARFPSQRNVISFPRPAPYPGGHPGGGPGMSGLGELGINAGPVSNFPGTNFPDWGTGSGGGSWQDYLKQMGAYWSTVLGTWITQKSAPQNPNYVNPTGVLNNQIGTQTPPPGGIGIGVDGQGIRLSDGSHIGWGTIAIVVGGIFLLQSRGFSRK